MTQPISDPVMSAQRERRARLNALEQGMYHTPETTGAQIEALLQDALADGDQLTEVTARCLLAGCALYTGQLPVARAELGAALSLATALGERSLEARMLNGLGLVHDRLGVYDRALEYFLSSLRITQELGDRVGTFRTLNNLASLYADTGQPEQAMAFHRQALDVALDLDTPVVLASSMTHLIVIHDQLGQSAEVLALAAQHADLIRTAGAPRWSSSVQECVSRALLRTGEAEAALRVGQADLEAARGRRDLEGISRMAVASASALLALGRHAEAEALLRESLQVSREVGSRPLERQALGGLSLVQEARGEYRDALLTARATFDLERQMHAREVGARSQLLTAQIRLDLLNREAEIERLRNVELAQANQNLKETQEVLLHRATHDYLTGVANRAYFQQVTRDALETLRPEQHAALIFIDLDRFKQVNDTLGHAAGDSLLQQVARRLEGVVRGTDLIGRMGGDEFTVLLRRVAEPGDVTLVAQKLADVLALPFTVGGQPVSLTASVGCAVAPGDGVDAEALQQRADVAMYSVKRSGGNQVQHFAADMGRPGERQQLERDLSGAVDRGELRLHYQARSALEGRALVGFEALVRWQHPQRGLLAPGVFIPVAEDSRAILRIGEWVLREACAQAARWAFEERSLCMSVNVSAMQFEQPGFVDTVRSALAAAGLPASRLVLEITESLVMRDLELAFTQVRQLKDMGVRIAIDDFGTGYSSLSVLQTLPFDQLKIDRSFTRHLIGPQGQRVVALMTAMIQLAHTLDMTVTVEGVEDDEQLSLLDTLGCDHVQGFLLARPLPPAGAQALIPGASPVSS